MKYTKADCGEMITPEESKKHLLDMLDTLTEYCDKHGVRYYLSGGTLLGAIRHKGFIPWDDDIDINIPRPDLEKLYKVSGGSIGKYVLVKPNDRRFDRDCQFYKIYNTDYIIEDSRGGALKDEFMYYPMNIDIFPIDGFPSGSLEMKVYCVMLIFLRKMLGIANYDKVIGKTRLGYFLHLLAFVPVKLIGYKNWMKWYQKCARRYKFNKCEYVGVTTVVHYIFGERVKKADYIRTIDVEFEGKKYHAPSNYDTYLSQLYGDYMKLPPVEKQVSMHKINLYKAKG